LASDPLRPIAQVAAGRYSDGFLRAIDSALAVKPEARPQSVAQFRRLLGLGQRAPRPASDARDTQLTVIAARKRTGRIRWIATGIVAAALLTVGALWLFLSQAPQAPQPVAASTARGERPADKASPPPAPTFDPLSVLDDVYSGRDAARRVTVAAHADKLRIDKDQLRFTVTSAQAGHVYVLYVGTDRSELLLLFPNDVDQDNRISAGRPLQLPRASWSTVAKGPAGTDHFVVLVSDSPRQFNGLGMRSVGDVGFGEFPLDLAAQIVASQSGRSFAGQPACRVGVDAGCSAAYGAARFRIEEVTS
jgi:hypothetical protein